MVVWLYVSRLTIESLRQSGYSKGENTVFSWQSLVAKPFTRLPAESGFFMPTIQEIQQRCLALAGNPAPVVAPDPTAHWFRRSFSPEEVAEFKRVRSEKDRAIERRYGHQVAYGFAMPNAWAGSAGEAAFAELLQSVYQWTDGIHFTHWERDDDTDDRDFTLHQPPEKKPIEIDVKTRAINVDPRPDYEGNLKAEQYNKITDPRSVINTLVFVDYVLPQDLAIVFGWITVPEFKAKAVFRPKGSVAGKITVSHDMYCIRIDQLRPFRKVVG